MNPKTLLGPGVETHSDTKQASKKGQIIVTEVVPHKSLIARLLLYYHIYYHYVYNDCLCWPRQLLRLGSGVC